MEYIGDLAIVRGAGKTELVAADLPVHMVIIVEIAGADYLLPSKRDVPGNDGAFAVDERNSPSGAGDVTLPCSGELSHHGGVRFQWLSILVAHQCWAKVCVVVARTVSR